MEDKGELRRRMSPRLNRNQSEGRASSNSSCSPPKNGGGDDGGSFMRRMSPRFQNANDKSSSAASTRMSPRRLQHANLNHNNAATSLALRLSPNQQNHHSNKYHEDASKDSVIQRRLSPRLHHHHHHHHPNNPDCRLMQSRVKDTLRIFNTHYLQFCREERDKDKDKGEPSTNKKKRKRNKHKSQDDDDDDDNDDHKRTAFRPDLKALKIMRANNQILFTQRTIGTLPGIDVGYQFYSRAEMVAVGIHKHWLSGIDFIGISHSQTTEELKKYTLPIAVSVVMSGQYEDDQDNVEEILYTGQGGNAFLGSKQQKKDQELIRGNLALKNNMEQSIPVRVMRGHDNPSSYSGKIYSYDGLYEVVETLPETGISGYLVYKFRLMRLGGQPKLTTGQVEFVKGGQAKSPVLHGLVCGDITNGQEDFCIPVTNIYADPPVGPPGFTYIKSLQVAENVKLPPYAAGCNCVGNCSNPASCACATLNGSDFPYVRQRGGRLVEPKDIVFECGPNCGCGPECLNRTSQRGIKFQLEVYRTLDKGWAVRTREYIPSGAPVCEYIGVLSRSDELDNVAENDYIFEIDCWHTMNEIEGRERRGNLPMSVTNNLPRINEEDLDRSPEFSIDAGVRGNVARFINHSCEPNLFVQCILSSHHDLRLARVVLFAADDIHPMQELTYDYGYVLDSVVGPDGKVKESPCFCGTPECRGRLY